MHPLCHSQVFLPETNLPGPLYQGRGALEQELGLPPGHEEEPLLLQLLNAYTAGEKGPSPGGVLASPLPAISPMGLQQDEAQVRRWLPGRAACDLWG